jgi:SAM-dependent methyltransferase
VTDAWTVGASYEPYVGRWSRVVAAEFLPWLGVAPGASWLDVGCGTGALTESILALAEPRSVIGVDPSEGYVRHATNHVTDPRASFRTGEGAALPFDDLAFDVVVSGLVLNFVPDADRGLSEMRRVARPGGLVGAYVWDYVGRMEMIRTFWDAAVELDPDARELDEGVRFPVCTLPRLQSAFEGAGLEKVEVRAIDAPTRFRDFDDYWMPFLGGQGPAPSYATSLDPSRREALRERIREALSIREDREDGSIHLVARAWAARGTVPV